MPRFGLVLIPAAAPNRGTRAGPESDLFRVGVSILEGLLNCEGGIMLELSPGLELGPAIDCDEDGACICFPLGPCLPRHLPELFASALGPSIRAFDEKSRFSPIREPRLGPIPPAVDPELARSYACCICNRACICNCCNASCCCCCCNAAAAAASIISRSLNLMSISVASGMTVPTGIIIPIPPPIPPTPMRLLSSSTSKCASSSSPSSPIISLSISLSISRSISRRVSSSVSPLAVESESACLNIVGRWPMALVVALRIPSPSLLSNASQSADGASGGGGLVHFALIGAICSSSGCADRADVDCT